MGVSLSNSHSEHERFNWSSWREILCLAYEHGWKPEGTKPNLDWCSHWELGPDAEPEVEMAWQEANRERIEQELDGSYFANEGQIVTAEDAANMADALDEVIGEFEGENRQVLEAFVAFLRRGDFAIF